MVKHSDYPPRGVRFFGGGKARDSADAGRLFFIYGKILGR